MATYTEHRIFGPPGTGKTTYLSRQIDNAVKSVGSNRVLVASFTRAAAAELVGRNLPINREQIGTLHAHCYRALGKPEIAETRLKEWNEIAGKFKFSETWQGADLSEPGYEQNYKTDGDEAMATCQNLRARMVPRELWPNGIRYFDLKWQEWKDSIGAIDFTDMIELAYKEVDTAPGGPAIGFFDEAQDFTKLELALVRKWAENMDYILLAGDDDQCLYGFKGATPDAFLLPEIAEEYKRILTQSYRVPEEVRKIAQGWVERLSRREPKEYKPRDYRGAVLRSVATFKYPNLLGYEIEEHLANNKRVMILATCGYMLDPVKHFLRGQGIPFHNPYRRKRGDWNPLHSRKGAVSSGERLLSFLGLDDGGQWGMWTGEQLKNWLQLLKSQGLLQRGAKKAAEEHPLLKEADWDFLAGVFEKEEDLHEAFNGNLEWFYQKLLPPKRKPMEFPLRVVRNRGPEGLINEPQIIIGTIHSVKGGEADVVYLFPDLSRAGMEQWISSGAKKDTVIRQFYVGMTRAKEALVLCSPSTELSVQF